MPSGYSTLSPKQVLAQRAEAMAYLAEQRTDILLDVLDATTDPVTAANITFTLRRKCDGSGVRIAADNHTVLGLCYRCDGLGVYGDPSCRS